MIIANMIGIGINPPGGQQQYSAELQAVIDRANTEGYAVPDSVRLSALDTFIKARKADGSWDEFDGLWIDALNNTLLQNFATINYKSPSTQLTPVNSPVYAVGGFQGDGVASYIDTNFNPTADGVNYTLNSASRGMWVYVDSGTVLDGVAGSTLNDMLSANSTSQRINSSSTLPVAVDLGGAGYRAINRTDANNVQCYVGTTRNDRTVANDALVNENQLILRRSALYGGHTISMYYVGGSLTETQHNNIANDFQAYLTAIGL